MPSDPEHAAQQREIERQQRDKVYAVRESFFQALLTEWARPPDNLDALMEQSDGYFKPDYAREKNTPDNAVFINDIPKGLLAVSVTPDESRNIPMGIRWVYSLMHSGDWLRYGMLFQGAPEALMRFEKHHGNLLAIERIWDRKCDHQLRSANGLLLEWRFVEPEFYDLFSVRERFIIMSRHLHFRLGKVLRPLLDEITALHDIYGDDWMIHHHETDLASSAWSSSGAGEEESEDLSRGAEDGGDKGAGFGGVSDIDLPDEDEIDWSLGSQEDPDNKNNDTSS